MQLHLPLPHAARRFLIADHGVAAIEFAIVTPILLVFLLGVICYGAYFWMAHDIQQLANDSARSAIAGLDADERRAIATKTFSRNVANLGGLDAAKAQLKVREAGDGITVTVSYDATGSAFWQVMDLFPMPSTTIVRSASVTFGGY